MAGDNAGSADEVVDALVAALRGELAESRAALEGPVQYGPRIAAVIVYLYAGQFLSKQRTAQALAEMFGVPLSSGTVSALTARAAGRLGGFLFHARFVLVSR